MESSIDELKLKKSSIYFDANNPETYKLDNKGNVEAMGIRQDGSFAFIQTSSDKRPSFVKGDKFTAKDSE